MVLTLVLDVLEVLPADALELFVTDCEHLVERETEVGALLVVASERHNVVVGELAAGQQASHQAAELVERHAHRFQFVEVERRALRLQRSFDAFHDRLNVRLRELQTSSQP